MYPFNAQFPYNLTLRSKRNSAKSYPAAAAAREAVRAGRQHGSRRDQMLGQISHSPSLYLKADPQQSLREDDIKRKPHTGVAPARGPSPHTYTHRVARCLIDTRLTTCKSPTPHCAPGARSDGVV